MTLPKYPEIEVQLTGRDGNAFAIMGEVTRALREAGVSEDERLEYRKQSMSGDYENLLRVACEWVSVS